MAAEVHETQAPPEAVQPESQGLPMISLPQDLFQRTLDSLHYALRTYESLEYRMPSGQEQAELVDNLVAILEKLQPYSNQLESSPGDPKQRWSQSERKASMERQQKLAAQIQENSRRVADGLQRDRTAAELEKTVERQTQEVEQLRAQLASSTKLFEQLGVSTLIALIGSKDVDVCRASTKALGNLATQELYQEEIVQTGGLKALFELIKESSTDEMAQRLAAGAVANLAVSEANQIVIVEQNGLPVLLDLGRRSGDPHTQKMVAGAIANLCGNVALKETLLQTGSMLTFINMVTTRNLGVLEQVARGIANFVVKNEELGKFIEDGNIRCLVNLAKSPSLLVRKHAGLAMYSLAQKDSFAALLLQAGAVEPLTAMRTCDSDSLRRMAEKTLSLLQKHEGSSLYSRPSDN